MDRQEMAVWMEEEHSRLHEQIVALRQMVVAMPRGDRSRWFQEVRAEFGGFCESLLEHMRLEEEDGYLKPVLEERPAVAGMVDLIRHEHVQLRVLIEHLESALHAIHVHDNLLVDDACRRIVGLLDSIERHEEHENHLVMYVFPQADAAGQ